MTEAAQRRALIIKAAERLLGHYGPQKTTIADVAREAGVGVGSVYLEFPSKDALVEELSRSRHHAVYSAMLTAATVSGGSYRARLTGVFDARLQAFFALADEGAHACDLVHCVSAAVKTAQKSFQEEELALVASVVRSGAEAGELERRDPEATARALLRAYATFSPPWIWGQERGEAERAIAAMHELVLNGVLRRRATATAQAPAGSRRRS